MEIPAGQRSSPFPSRAFRLVCPNLTASERTSVMYPLPSCRDAKQQTLRRSNQTHFREMPNAQTMAELQTHVRTPDRGDGMPPCIDGTYEESRISVPRDFGRHPGVKIPDRSNGDRLLCPQKMGTQYNQARFFRRRASTSGKRCQKKNNHHPDSLPSKFRVILVEEIQDI